MYFLQFFFTISKVIFISLTQLKKSNAWAKHYLKELEFTYNGKFEPAIISKIARYQSIQLHFVANVFSGLYGRKNTNQEQLKNLQYFITTVLYDAFFDEDKLAEARINELFYHPEKAVPTQFSERVFIAMHLALLKQVADKGAYWNTIHNLHLAQQDSAKQFNTTTSKEEILAITIRKGGYSLLICRHYLQDPIHENIDQCWYALGGLIQMTNDLYDTYKDTESGIRTFANEAKQISTIQHIYETQKQQFKQLVIKLPFNYHQKIVFSIHMSVIAAFGDIAIQQLKGITTNSGTLPNFKEIPRKLLIIDMELVINKYRLIKYAYKNGKLWT